MKVKCINDEGWNQKNILTKGKVYEVLNQDSLRYKILDDLGLIKVFAKARFEIVEEEEDNNMKNTKNKFYNIDIFNWDDFKNGNIAVLCNTEELARDFLDKCDEQGVTLGASVITNGMYSVVSGHYDYRWWQGNNIKVIQWEINNNEMKKTFQEVIATIKEREIWVCEKINRKIIKGDDGIIEIRKLNNKTFDRITALMIGNEKYKLQLQRKEYTFKEAFKAYEEGKEIESCYSGVTYKLQHGGSDCFGGGQKTSTIAFNEIRGKWYIND